MQEVKNRPIKELLQLMLDNINSLESGLCLLNLVLMEKSLISNEECDKIKLYLIKNEPNNKHYWFPICEKQPRIEWLQQQIKKQDSFLNKIKKLWS